MCFCLDIVFEFVQGKCLIVNVCYVYCIRLTRTSVLLLLPSFVSCFENKTPAKWLTVNVMFLGAYYRKILTLKSYLICLVIMVISVRITFRAQAITEQHFRSALSYLKGIVHPKITILSLFTHPQVVPNMYECICSAEHKGRYSEECGKQSSSGAPLTYIVFFFLLWKSMVPQNILVTNFLQNIFLCVRENK